MRVLALGLGAAGVENSGVNAFADGFEVFERRVSVGVEQGVANVSNGVGGCVQEANPGCRAFGYAGVGFEFIMIPECQHVIANIRWENLLVVEYGIEAVAT